MFQINVISQNQGPDHHLGKLLPLFFQWKFYFTKSQNSTIYTKINFFLQKKWLKFAKAGIRLPQNVLNKNPLMVIIIINREILLFWTLNLITVFRKTLNQKRNTINSLFLKNAIVYTHSMVYPLNRACALCFFFL